MGAVFAVVEAVTFKYGNIIFPLKPPELVQHLSTYLLWKKKPLLVLFTLFVTLTSNFQSYFETVVMANK